MYASLDGIRTTARPHLTASCPGCQAPVTAKCGTILAWHWAHQARADCDPWAEPDSHWHRTWQREASPDRREVAIGAHRADIVTADGIVVELQHSAISPTEIAEREDHYGRMVWLFDATDAYCRDRLDLRRRDGYHSFRWRHPRKSIAACTAQVLLDLDGYRVLSVRKFYPGAPCGGWGHLIPADQVRHWVASEYPERSPTGQCI